MYPMRNSFGRLTPQADELSLAAETIRPLDPNLLSPPATRPELPLTQPPMDAATAFNNLEVRGPSLDGDPSQGPRTSYLAQPAGSYVPQYPSKYEYREYATDSYKDCNRDHISPRTSNVERPEELPSFLQEDKIGREPIMAGAMTGEDLCGDDDGSPGVALGPVKEKWTQLGPLKLEDIIANSSDPINQALQFG